jgi:hypothetical protein
VDAALRDLQARRMRINNLFQRMDGLWQCNLRSADNNFFFEYGKHETATGAIEQAVLKMEHDKRVTGAKACVTGVAVDHPETLPPPAPETPGDEDDLIG